MSDDIKVRAIDADVVIERLQDFITDLDFISREDVKCIIDDVPTLDVAPLVHAAWLLNSDGYYPYCTNCFKEPTGRATSDYCPNCGAIMDGDGLKIRVKSESHWKDIKCDR